MKTCLFLCIFILSSCSSSKEGIALPQPASERLIVSENKADSRVSASAEAIKKANELNSNGNSKLAIDAEASLIITSTGVATLADAAAAMSRIDKYIQGKTKEAEAARATAEADAKKSKSQIDLLRDLHAKEVSEAKAEIATLKAKSEESRKENVTLWFAFVGSLLASIGVLAVAFSPFKQGGAVLAIAGVLIGGSGLLWDSTLFKVSASACAIAAIAYTAYYIYKRNK